MQADPHERARFLIDEELVGGTGDSEREWLRQHLGECRECANHAELSARIVRGFQSFSFETDPEMNARVRKRIGEHLELAARPKRSHAQRRWLVAAAALLLLAAVPIYRFRRDRQREAAMTEMDRADALLLDRVNARVEREVPVAMEPLMLTVTEGENQ